MDEKFLRALESKKYMDDQVHLSQVQQLFGDPSAHSILSATSNIKVNTLATIAATNVYAPQPYYKYKKEVDDAALFMDNKLKFHHSMFIQYAQMIQCTNLMTHLQYHQVMQLLNTLMLCVIIIYFTPGSRCNYAINDTKNIIKHQNFLSQALENIAQHSGAFPVGKIKYKWDNLHKALI